MLICTPEKKKISPGVINPIYESGSDMYEELPDVTAGGCNPSGSSQPYVDNIMAPVLPPARQKTAPSVKIFPATENKDNMKSSQDINGDKLMMHDTTTAESMGAHSELSCEDVYTIMSPAGTMTVLPRNRCSGSHSMASWAAGSFEEPEEAGN